MSLVDTGKFIALILRHKPETIGITLDEHGWANVDELISGVNKTHPIDMHILEEIVRTDNKQRYSFNEDKTLIRANQGHSIPVDVELEKVTPPKYLYHGTALKYRDAIDREGLKAKSRLYVHLSPDIDTAINVGKRHGKPFVYRVSTLQMSKKGFEFFKSVNGVWLTKEVPTKYIKRETFDDSELNFIVNEISLILLQKQLDDEEDNSRVDAIFRLEAKYTWEVLQQALFRVLLQNERADDDYYQIALAFWCAVLESTNRKERGVNKLKFKKKTIIGLLYYRLRNIDYAEDIIWSITCDLFHLDYCNSEYKPLTDSKIINKLKKYGIEL